MSKYSIEGSTLSAISDAVREKDGTTEGIKVSDLASRILAIPAGGGGEELPEEAFNITGVCQYKFCYDGWNWFLNAYGNKITTNNITNTTHMFGNNQTIESIPFDINIGSTCKQMGNTFYYCKKLKSIPLIKGTLSTPTGNYSGVLDMGYFFSYCDSLREIPYDYFYNFGGEDFWEASKKYQGGRQCLFQGCYSLRKLPDMSMLKTAATAAYNNFYASAIYSCYALDEVINFPVIDSVAINSNFFSSTFYNIHRIKNLTFETNADGSPIVVQWKNQTIDLTSYVGYVFQTEYSITGYNSGLTTATKITDDATYAELKDNEDSWTMNINYSRYNHDSAVATLNSLPDSSAYGTNIIKFQGASGALTDGGAINTLTEEEIAVAAAKGWTVTLV